jgi:hypothetical protein
MFNIEKFLEKFSKATSSAEEQKKQIREIIEKQTSLIIPPKDLEIKNFTIFINSSGTVKNKIFISKNQILEEIEKTVKTKIVDIR